MPDLPRVGEEFAGYRLISRLGRGGMSAVFQAENWRLGNVVALKILAPELASDDTFRTRFLQESRIAASLNHPHVVPIIDYGPGDGGLLYIAMRYVAGTDLGEMITERGRLEPDIAVHLLSQAALALDAAHRQGLVHRDVKPANLLLERTSDDTDPDHLYLADFGITKHVTGLARLTSAGRPVGTPLYVAPEQAQELAVYGAADQYALGCVLYECLTGRVPFEKGSSNAIAWAHVTEAPPPATLLRPDLPPAIDEVFARVLAKHPDERYATCREFMTAARDALGTTREQPPGGWAAHELRPAPLPPGGYPEVANYPAEEPYNSTQSMGLPVMEPLPGAWQQPGDRPQAAEEHYPGDEPYRDEGPYEGAGQYQGGGQYTGGAGRAGEPPGNADWPFFPADGGESRGGPGKPARSRRVRGRRARGRLSPVGLWSLAAFVVAAASVGGVMLADHAGHEASGKARSVAESSTPPSTLVSVLDQTEHFTGMLRMSACKQVTATDVQCDNPNPAIATVSFVTYPTLGALYSKYQEIVGNLTGQQPFAAVENKGVCSGIAPEPTDESAWNHSDGYSTKYSVNQMASGNVPTDIAMGRVFCEQTPNGSAVFVWTQDSGRLLGYATGSDASHEDVWSWFYNIHHHIIFPGQPGMADMPASPTATATGTAMSPSAAASGTSTSASGGGTP